MTHRTFDEQIANFNRVVSSWDINQEYKVALLGMIASLGYEHEKSITPEPHEIGYNECANALLKMWMDNVLTDGEYYRIADKLNKKWGKTELPEPYKGVTS